MTTLRLPRTFYDDHVARDLPGGIVHNATKSHVHVTLDPLELAELLSDARHYASEWKFMGREFAGLGASARATVRVIEAELAATLEEGYRYAARGGRGSENLGPATYSQPDDDPAE